MLKRIKKAIKNLLEKMAKDNEKTFGRSTLDCCQLNRSISSNSNRK